MSRAIDLVADLEAEDAAEAAALAERQRKRREAIRPVAELASEILRERDEFLTREQERLTELTAAVRRARKAGAPKDRLDSLTIDPLAGKKRRPRRARSTSNPAQVTPESTPDGDRDQAPQMSA